MCRLGCMFQCRLMVKVRITPCSLVSDYIQPDVFGRVVRELSRGDPQLCESVDRSGLTAARLCVCGLCEV